MFGIVIKSDAGTYECYTFLAHTVRLAKFITISFLTAYIGLYDKWHTYQNYVKTLLKSKQDEEKKKKEREIADSASKLTIMNILPIINAMSVIRHSHQPLAKAASEESLIIGKSPVNETKNLFETEKKENKPGPSGNRMESSKITLSSKNQLSPSKSISLLDIYSEEDIDYFGINFESIDLSPYPINDDFKVDSSSDPDTLSLLEKENPLWDENSKNLGQETPENLLSKCIPMFDLEENIDAAIQLEISSRSVSQSKNKNN